jgi:hypothetical protein
MCPHTCGNPSSKAESPSPISEYSVQSPSTICKRLCVLGLPIVRTSLSTTPGRGRVSTAQCQGVKTVRTGLPTLTHARDRAEGCKFDFYHSATWAGMGWVACYRLHFAHVRPLYQVRHNKLARLPWGVEPHHHHPEGIGGARTSCSCPLRIPASRALGYRRVPLRGFKWLACGSMIIDRPQ